MMTLRRLISTTLSMVVLVASGSLFAFELEETSTGHPLKWNREDMPVNWYLDESVDPDIGFERSRRALESSFYAWQAVDCSYLSFTYEGPIRRSYSQVGTVDIDTYNVMIWIAKDDWDGEWTDAYAVTVPVFETNTGRILDADILFNTNFGWSDASEGEADKADVQNIATHEIGHLFGLNHSDTVDATMFFSAVPGEIYKRSLAGDDIQGVCHIYPINGRNGSPCESDTDCEPDLSCIENLESGGSVCAKACECSPDCPESFRCRDGYCVAPKPEIGGFGDECTSQLPCSEGYICVSGLCSIYCNDQPDCPDGWQCTPLMGVSRWACYTDNPGGSVAVIKVESVGFSPQYQARVGEKVTISATASGASGILYRFSMSKDRGEWQVLRNYTPIKTASWTPDAGGDYRIRVEARLSDSDSCADAERIENYYVLGSDTPPDTPNTPTSGDSGGCAGAGASPLVSLFFVLIALLRRRTSTCRP